MHADRHLIRLAVQTTAGGALTAEKVKELEETRTKFGLSQASAQKIIKGAQNQHLISNMNVSPFRNTILPSVMSACL